MVSRTPAPDDIRLGLVMTDARNALGLTQEEVGARLAVDGNTVSRWEQGQNRPRRMTAAKLEKMYGLPAGTLTKGVPVGKLPRDSTPLHPSPAFPHDGDATAGVLWAAEQMSETVTRLIREARRGAGATPATGSGGGGGLPAPAGYGNPDDLTEAPGPPGRVGGEEAP